MKCQICNSKIEDYGHDIYYCYKCQELYILENYQLKFFKSVEDYQEVIDTINEIEFDLLKEGEQNDRI